MKIAFYGRYSSDNQRETSIDDQRRVVQQWAKRLGHELVRDYSDFAVSGASALRLTGLQDAIRVACARPAPFEALVVDQLSRLSRDVGDTDAMIKRLRFFGARVIAVSDGLDTGDEHTKISVTVKSLVNELYLDDLRKTTKRGLDGQFLKGYSTGGRTYGYRSEPVCEPTGDPDSRGRPAPVGYRLAVVPEEAATIRELFRLFRDGHGEKAIAKQLNATNPGRAWRPNTIYLMLQNPKYVGQITFNRREWHKNPDTGRRVYRLRPPDQWERITSEALRIIDDETWNTVQRRLRGRQHLFSNRRSATVHLLSGLLVCHRCGGRFSIVARDYYGCRNHTESGTCPSDLRIRREAIENVVIGELARRLPAWIEALSTAATRQPPVPSARDTQSTQRHLKKLRKQAQTLLEAIQHGRLHGQALDNALRTYQALWDQAETVELAGHSAVQAQPTQIRYDPAVVADFLTRLPQALRADVRLGREFLRETLKHVQVDAGENRPRQCPVCQRTLGKLTPQHLRRHGLTLQNAYREFTELGFNRGARLLIQPSPEGLLNTGEVFGLVVAGAGYAECHTAPTTYWVDLARR
jgi:site-specific DNA recombinase